MSDPAPPLLGRLQAGVAARPGLALAALAALVVALIASLLFYRGLGPFGPYAGAKKKKAPPRGKADPDSDSDGGGGGGAEDEARRLIASLNRAT
jgi:hypothetical protein